MFTLPLLALALAADPPTLAVHTGHVERKGSELSGEVSFLLFTDFAAFEKAFGTAPAVGIRKPNPVTKATFDTSAVAAVVKRGKAVVVYTEVTAKADGDTLTVSYKTQPGTPGTADVACPLVVAVPIGVTKAVFVENGKEVGSAK
jgi:hypothetical protein